MRTSNGALWREPIKGGRRPISCAVHPQVRAKVIERATAEEMTTSAYVAKLLAEHVGVDES